MRKNEYILTLFISSIVAWLAFFIVLTRFAPGGDFHFLALILFYLTLFFGVSTAFGLTNYYFRLYFSSEDTEFFHLNTALRQGVLLALFILGMLTMMHFEILRWWSALIYSLLIFGIEMTFLCRE